MRISTIKQRGRLDTFRQCRSNAFPFPGKRIAAPTITPHFSENSELDKIIIGCSAGIAQIEVINGNVVKRITYDSSRFGDKTESTTLDLDDFDWSMPLYVGVLGCDGQTERTPGVWKPTHRLPIRIDDSDIILNKQSVLANDTEQGHQWTVMLNEKGLDGKLSRAKRIDICVGAVLGEVVVHYEDGHTTPCGHRYGDDGATFDNGGRGPRLSIPQGVDVVKVEVKTYGSEKYLAGLYFTLSDGSKGGEHSARFTHDTTVLEPGSGERIVGFYGSTWNYTQEFGIITGPKDVELPPQTYDMPQLQNLQEGSRISIL